MKSNLFLILLSLWSLSLFSQNKSEEQIINTNWEFKYKDKWLDAKVPGNNYSDLLNHKIIPNPFVGTNEKDVQWIKNLNWEYKTTFTPSEEIFLQEKKELIFEGLDTYAEVFLNDEKILTADNQFRTWTADVSDLLKKGGANQIFA